MRHLNKTMFICAAMMFASVSYAKLTVCNVATVNKLNQRYNTSITQSDFTSNDPIYASKGIFAHVLDENTDIQPKCKSNCSSIWNIIKPFDASSLTQDFAFTYIAKDLQPTYQIPLYNAYSTYSVVGLILDPNQLSSGKIMCVYPLDATTAMRTKNGVSCPCGSFNKSFIDGVRGQLSSADTCSTTSMPDNYSYNKYLNLYLPTTASGTDDQCKGDMDAPYCKMAPLPGNATGFNVMAQLSQAVNLDPRRNATYHEESGKKSGLGYNEIDISSSNWGNLLRDNYPIQVFFATCSSVASSDVPCTKQTDRKSVV